MIDIDGSHGEGGGQIVRTAVSLSAIYKEPVRITNIRAGRDKPGLRPQHLCAVDAARQVTDGRADGLEIGSKEIAFIPGEIISGTYNFDIGTAGSVHLLLQTLVPIALSCGQKFVFRARGGTDVPFSPPADYFRRVYVHNLRAMGYDIEYELLRRGCYPKGGGKVEVRCGGGKGRGDTETGGKGKGDTEKDKEGFKSFERAENTKEGRREIVVGKEGVEIMDVNEGKERGEDGGEDGGEERGDERGEERGEDGGEERGEDGGEERGEERGDERGDERGEDGKREERVGKTDIKRLDGHIFISKLDRSIAERIKSSAMKMVAMPLTDMGCRYRFHIHREDALDPGVGITLVAERGNGVRLGASVLGRKGLRSEKVGATAAEQILVEIRSGADLDVHASDQMLVPIQLGGGGSFGVREVSRHTRTQAWLVNRLLK